MVGKQSRLEDLARKDEHTRNLAAASLEQFSRIGGSKSRYVTLVRPNLNKGVTVAIRRQTISILSAQLAMFQLYQRL